MYPKKYLYFADVTEYAPTVKENGLRRGKEGCIYLTETEEDALRMISYREGTDEVTTFKIRVSELEYSKLLKTTEYLKKYVEYNTWVYFLDIPWHKITVAHNY